MRTRTAGAPALAPAAPPPSAFGSVGPSGGGRLADSRSLEQQRRDSKIHPAISALIARVKDPTAQRSADEAKFVRNGKAEIRIVLTDASPATMAKLEELGFEIVLQPAGARMLIGRLPLEKLSALVELPFVRYIAPQY